MTFRVVSHSSEPLVIRDVAGAVDACSWHEPAAVAGLESAPHDLTHAIVAGTPDSMIARKVTTTAMVLFFKRLTKASSVPDQRRELLAKIRRSER